MSRPRDVGEAPRLPTVSALDGLRAVAVGAVVLYHAGVSWIPGGFLGVEVFFVLSGYLITALLWREWRASGRIALGAFWARRARRLLPALFTLLLAVGLALLLAWPEGAARIRDELLAALGYGANWYEVGADRSYFESFEASPLRHLWSLGIEEQFYLLWPLVLWVLAARLRRPARVARCFAVAALVSAGLMWLLHSPADPSRAYYGTDTRAAGLLVGAALAVVWRPFERPWRAPASVPERLVLGGATALSAAVLAWAFLAFDESAGFSFSPGLLLVDLATATLIAAAVHPASRLGARVLGAARLRAVGRRSYGIYLWHWPIFFVVRPEADGGDPGVPLLLLRLALVALVVEVSYRYVEQPFRDADARERLRRAVARARRGWGERRRLGLAGAGAMLGVAALAGSLGGLPATSSSELLGASAGPAWDAARWPHMGRGTTEVASRVTAPAPPRVVAIGDSVMLGARGALRRAIPGVTVDAAVGRQVSNALRTLRRLRGEGRLGDFVVVHLGNNGRFTMEQFHRMMRMLRDVRRVVVLNVRVPRRWERQVNRVVVAGARRYPNAVVLGWRVLSRSCRGRTFVRDGVHLTRAGARCYASLIAGRI